MPRAQVGFFCGACGYESPKWLGFASKFDALTCTQAPTLSHAIAAALD